VARAGVVARARVTADFVERRDALGFFRAVWRAFGLAVWRAFGFALRRAFGLALWRDVVRALLFALLCDAAAFNCFPFIRL
jgi:hypothetical protein